MYSPYQIPIPMYPLCQMCSVMYPMYPLCQICYFNNVRITNDTYSAHIQTLINQNIYNQELLNQEILNNAKRIKIKEEQINNAQCIKTMLNTYPVSETEEYFREIHALSEHLISYNDIVFLFQLTPNTQYLLSKEKFIFMNYILNPYENNQLKDNWTELKIIINNLLPNFMDVYINGVIQGIKLIILLKYSNLHFEFDETTPDAFHLVEQLVTDIKIPLINTIIPYEEIKIFYTLNIPINNMHKIKVSTIIINNNSQPIRIEYYVLFDKNMNYTIIYKKFNKANFYIGIYAEHRQRDIENNKINNKMNKFNITRIIKSIHKLFPLDEQLLFNQPEYIIEYTKQMIENTINSICSTFTNSIINYRTTNVSVLGE